MSGSSPRPWWRSAEVWIPAAFAVASAAWVALSDRAMVALAGTSEQLERWSIWKGWGYVVVVAACLHLGLRRTLRRRDEALARAGRSEAEARRMIETSPDAILIQRDYRIMFANEAAVRLFGAPGSEALMGRPIFDLIDPADHAGVRERSERVEGGQTFQQVLPRRMRRLDGTPIHAEVAAARLERSDLPAAMMITIRDVTAAWRLQEEVRRTNAALRTLGACNEALVRAGSEAELMREVCRIAVQFGEYRMAWAGVAEHDEAHTLRPVALEGLDRETFDRFAPRWRQDGGTLGPAARAVVSGEPVVVNQALADPAVAPWRGQIEALGIAASLALPLSLAGERLGVLALYAREPDAFTAPVLQLLRQLADDLAFGLVALRTRAALADEREVLSASRRQLRALAARLETVREEEQTRIARDLHDELGQLVTGLKMDLRWIEDRLSDLPPGEPVNALLDRVVASVELADQTVASVQRIASELRPGALDRLGLGPALRQEARLFQARTGIACEVALDEAAPEPGPEAATALYRICQEAMTNVWRHAGATRVEVSLRAEGGALLLEVRDDGRGLGEAAHAPGALGLLGMQERATRLGGELRFHPGPGRGTVVSARIPLAAPAAEASP